MTVESRITTLADPKETKARPPSAAVQLSTKTGPVVLKRAQKGVGNGKGNKAGNGLEGAGRTWGSIFGCPAHAV